MSQLFLIAYRNLVQHSKRTLMLGGAIAGVTFLLVFLICLSTGIRETMLRSATTVMTGHLNVGGFYKVTAGQSAPLVTEYKRITEIVRRTLPDIDFITPRGRGFGKIVSDTASLQAGIAGIDIANEPGFKRVLQITQGNIEDLAKPGTILLFEQQAKKLEARVGDSLVISVLTTNGTSNTIDVRVVAVAQDVGMISGFNAFISTQSLNQLVQVNNDTTGVIQIHVKDMAKIPEDIEKLQKALNGEGFQILERESKAFWMKFESINREDWTGQKLDLTTWEDEISFLRWMITGIDGLMYALTLVLLVIIGVGIMNSMWIAIRERTREIGTLRAIGMQRMRVLAMFVIEAFTLGALSTVAGALASLLFALVLNAFHLHVADGVQNFLMSNTLQLGFDPLRIFTGMLVITASTTLISLIPSAHAARMKPITAMQHVG